MGFHLLSQVSPNSFILSCLLPVFDFQLFFFRSSMTSSCHRCLGLPIGLVPIGFQSNSFLVGLARSIFWICPSYLILCAFVNLTICKGLTPVITNTTVDWTMTPFCLVDMNPWLGDTYFLDLQGSWTQQVSPKLWYVPRKLRCFVSKKGVVFQWNTPFHLPRNIQFTRNTIFEWLQCM